MLRVAMPSDEALIVMWRSTQPADRIAYDAHVPLAELYRQWRRLKWEGRLPDRPRTPQREAHGPRSHGSSGAPVVAADGRPTVGERDRLLAALQREHGQRVT
jgi:hypothetical protein